MDAVRKEENEGDVYKMDVTLVHKDEEQTLLRIQGVSPAYMNALRRIMMTEVPVLAIENVELRKNNSALYDEQLALRLGLLSISTDLGSYNLPSECKCKGAGCAQCQVKMTLSATGPKTVYAEEINSQDPKATPVFGKTVLVKLLDGQEVELEATAVMGQGKTHVKWNAGLIYYKEFPHLTITSQPDNADALVEKYPEILEKKSGKLSIKEDQLPFYDIHESVIAESNGSISVDYKDDYILYIESWKQLSAKEIMEKAISIYDEQLDQTNKLVKEV